MRLLIFLLNFLFIAHPQNIARAAFDYPLIVEVQISGEKSSDDFVKIHNPTDSDIYLGNYKDSYLRLVKRTKTSNKDYTIKSWAKNPLAKIPAKGIYLWANKDFTILSDADVSSSQTIAANNGVALRLGTADTGIIIDAIGFGDFNNVLAEEKSFPENPKPNQTLSRKQINGTYQDTNNNFFDFYLNNASTSSLAQVKIFIGEQEKQSEAPPNFPSGVVINEILPSPEGSDVKEEWIEVFNQNNFEVNLSGWKISDLLGKRNVYVVPEGTKISPQGFLVLSRGTTKIILNNEGDGVSLLQPDEKTAEIVNFEKAPRGQSYSRVDAGWVWSPKLTPGEINIKDEELPQNEKSQQEIKDFYLATAGYMPKKPFSFSFTLLTALLAAVLSGLIILTLKRKLSSLSQKGLDL